MFSEALSTDSGVERRQRRTPLSSVSDSLSNGVLQHSVRSSTSGSSQKANGVCSVCYLTRKLHQKNGKVHLHGLRSKLCLGSNKLPLPDHQTALSRTIPSTKQHDQQHQSGCTESSFSQGTHSEV